MITLVSRFDHKRCDQRRMTWENHLATLQLTAIVHLAKLAAYDHRFLFYGGTHRHSRNCIRTRFKSTHYEICVIWTRIWQNLKQEISVDAAIDRDHFILSHIEFMMFTTTDLLKSVCDFCRLDSYTCQA